MAQTNPSPAAGWDPSRWKPLTLKTRLVALLLGLLLAALALLAGVTLTTTRSYLDQKNDQQLTQALDRALRDYSDGYDDSPYTGLHGTEVRPGGPALNTPQSALLAADGTILSLSRSILSDEIPLHEVPQSVVRQARSRPTRFTLDVRGVSYAGAAAPVAGTPFVALVLLPVQDADDTYRRLALTIAAAGLAVLALASLLAWRVVGIGLTPLRHFADITEAVASGSHERRVTVPDDAEVRRLGNAINAAFDAREASERRLRSFISDASHELRTPLTSIRGYAELLGSGAMADPAKARRATERIEREAERLGVMVNDLLVIARLDEGRALERTPVDLGRIARDVAADAQVIDPDRRVCVEAPDRVVVPADEPSVRQILTNLLSNVRDHTPAGTPAEIGVGLEDGHAVLTVRDHGPGMSEENRRRAFDRFWRENPSRRSSGSTNSGSGLGLSIVAALAQAHGGDATAEAAPGGGTVMRIRLPGA